MGLAGFSGDVEEGEVVEEGGGGEDKLEDIHPIKGDAHDDEEGAGVDGADGTGDEEEDGDGGGPAREIVGSEEAQEEQEGTDEGGGGEELIPDVELTPSGEDESAVDKEGEGGHPS